MFNNTFAVVMPVYHGEQYLNLAIESILSQSLGDFKFFIIDDGSQDNSLEIIRSYHDSRICLFKNSVNRGLVFSLNKALHYSDQDIIIRMDADDISAPNRIKSMKRVFDQMDIVWCNSKITLINEIGRNIGEPIESKINPRYFTKYLPYMNFFCHGASAFRREYVLSCGGYRQEAMYTEDYDLWLRLASQNAPFYFIQDPLYQLRIHQKSLSNINKRYQHKQRIKISYKYLGENQILNLVLTFVYHNVNKVTVWLLDYIEIWIKHLLLFRSS